MYRNLYIHVPFCRKKCDYCAFYSLEHANADDWNAWLDRICAQLKNAVPDLRAHTVYFGGGTPTLPDADFLERMFDRILSLASPEADAEISAEANPETIDPAKAAVLAKFVNRVSMGIQSFDRTKRAALGRKPESADGIPAAANMLRDAGIGNLGFDLMYAVPGETLDVWQHDLTRTLMLDPTHISTYALTPEEHTPYARKHGLAPVSDTVSEIMARAAESVMEVVGLYRYEVSNFARPGFSAKHNENVWFGETYLGLGPSACSFDGTDRRTERADFHAWLNGADAELDRIPRENRVREIFMMGLRTVRGWTRTRFTAAAGCGWDSFADTLDSLRADGLIDCDAERCRPTARGLNFWNDIAERLLP